MQKVRTCCFTGHRPQKLPFGFNENDWRYKELRKALYQHTKDMITLSAVNRFISGMALGTDIWAAETVLELKEKYPEISLEAAVPCKGQCSRWSEQDQARYKSILRRCDSIVLLQEEYTYDCMLRRNRYMVDNSDFVIALWDGSSGGTEYTVMYARSRGIPVDMIDLGPLLECV